MNERTKNRITSLMVLVFLLAAVTMLFLFLDRYLFKLGK